MTEEMKTQPNPRDSLVLKLPEQDVSLENPWCDDVLGRAELATRLTNLIKKQQAPFVISIDGKWGTGKTFFLQRWQKDLENNDFRAIYFNAWEDDFCDDPLLAILGQLSEYFKGNKFKELADQLFTIAIPLLRQVPLSLLQAQTGIQVNIDGKEQAQRNLLKEYLDQRVTKDELKQHLNKVATKVFEETGHPLVFIVDELDRCRPTFAIELLERVKHIFDVPNLVFVFGVNRDELCSALQSVYGDIDATVYLRRFFDMEFNLPEADSEGFCRILMVKFELAEFFQSLDKEANSKARLDEFQLLHKYLPVLWSRLGLSLRDMDYCVRMIALVAKSLDPQRSIFPWLLVYSFR